MQYHTYLHSTAIIICLINIRHLWIQFLSIPFPRRTPNLSTNCNKNGTKLIKRNATNWYLCSNYISGTFALLRHEFIYNGPPKIYRWRHHSGTHIKVIYQVVIAKIPLFLLLLLLGLLGQMKLCWTEEHRRRYRCLPAGDDNGRNFVYFQLLEVEEEGWMA